MKVVPMPTRVGDIPGQLRKLADEIDAGEHPEIASITAVADYHDGDLRVFGWGDTDSMRSVAALHAGLAWMANDRLARMP